MKKTFLTLLLIICFAFNTAAQYSVAGIDAMGMSWGKIGLSCERSFSKKVSGRLMLEGGRYIKMSTTPNDHYRMTGVGVVPEVRYYLYSGKRTAPEGLFAGAAARYLWFNETYNGIQQSGNILNTGFDIGYKFSYKHFCVELMVGHFIGTVESDGRFAAASVPRYFDSVKNNEQKLLRGEIIIGYVFPTIAKRD